MHKVSPFLWFDSQAEEAAEYYVDLFPDAAMGAVSRYGEAGPGPAGSAMTASFTLFGQEFTALNGGPIYSFTPAISFVIDCVDQAEVDYYWSAFSDGGKPGQCGWIEDRFGLSWQVVPRALYRLIADPDPEKARRVTEAMLGMGKLIVSELEAAHVG